MKRRIPQLLFILMFLCIGMNAHAQKYGYTHFGNIISAMPESATADTQLQAYQKTLSEEIEQKDKALKAKFETFQEQMKNNSLTILQRQTLEQEILNDERELQEFATSGDQKIDEKRRELLNPILEKAQKAIEDVAKENGYQLIFDTSIFNAVLMADESVDITGMVRSKLGI